MPKAATRGTGRIRSSPNVPLLSTSHVLPDSCPTAVRRARLQIQANMADRPGAEVKPKCTPTELLLKVILTGTFSHYETRGMIDDKRLEHMLSAGKQILYKTHQESDVRFVVPFVCF